MIVRFRPGVEDREVYALEERVRSAGVRSRRSPETERAILALFDRPDERLERALVESPVVEELVEPPPGELLVHRSFRERSTVVDVGGVAVGGEDVVVIAGPCSVESFDQMDAVAAAVASRGASLLRGGAYKPRTNPYSFQGLGVEGLRLLADAGRRHGLPVVSEVLDPRDVPTFVELGIDCLQIGARNMQNFALLKAVAEAGRPVLFKRGLAGTVSEWLQAAEYLLHGGAGGVILCERGIRTFETATRNTLDLTILPLLAEATHLPVVVDPAHAVGIARCIPPLARAAIAAGADGLSLEVHDQPARARSDGAQALVPAAFGGLVADVRVVAAAVGRRLA